MMKLLIAVIVMSFVHATAEEAAEHRSRVVVVDKHNKVAETMEHASALARPPHRKTHREADRVG